MIELTQLQTAIIKTNDEWENPYNSDELRKEYVQDYAREAYLTLLVILDKHDLKGMRKYAEEEWDKRKGNLTEGLYSDIVDMHFLAVTTDFLYPMLTALGNVFKKTEFTDNVQENQFKLTNAIDLLPHTALKINYRIENEISLDKLIDGFLTAIYPDLNSNPSLSLSEGYRQPDSSINSLKLLIEYKYIKTKNDIRKVIDEAQADIRNYAQSPWEYFYIIIAQKQNFTTKEKIEGILLKEPSTFKQILISVIKF